MGWSNPVVSLASTEALAIEIAEAIAASGVSLLASPTLLYNNSTPTPPGTPGLVGATVSNSWFPSGTTEAQAISDFNGYVGLPLGNQVERVYFTEGNYPASLSAQPLAAIIATGAKVQLCLKPLRTGISNPTIATSEQNNIANTITLLNSAVVNGNHVNFDIVLWTEPNIAGYFTGPAQYLSYIQTYANTVRSATCTATGQKVKLVYNPASYNQTTALSYYPGDSYTDVVSADYYGTDSKDGITLAQMAALADDHSPSPIPFGISEWNAVANPGDTLDNSDWLTYTNTNIIGFMSGRLAASKTNWDIIGYYGINVQNSPLNQVTSATDWKVPQIQAIYNDLSKAPPGGTGQVVNANSSTTLIPINPSPGGGYAMANGISYDVTFNLVSNASGSTVPFVVIQMNWYNVDALGVPPVSVKHWILPIGETGTTGTITTGSGPQHGQYLQIKVINKDTVACTITAQINSTGRTAGDDAWYWDSANSVNVPGYTEPNATAPFSGALLSLDQVAVPANTTSSYLMSLFDGEVYVTFTAGSAGALTFQVIPQPSGVTSGAAIYNEAIAASGADSRTILLPRAPCLLSIINGTSSAVNAYAQVIAND